MRNQTSIQSTIQAINSSCTSLGFPFDNYSCKTVSWNDVQRGTIGESLSCWGANITDTRLYEKSGKQLYVVRSDNWNEKIGKIKSDQVAVVVGNHIPGETSLKPITLQNFLDNISEYGNYAKLKLPDRLNSLSKEKHISEDVSIRFQTTFLPIPSETGNGSVEFCTEAYNYNTMSDSNPKNLVVLCTTQGIAIQQDGQNAKKLFHHTVDDNNLVHQYWLEAEISKHKVGGAQIETIAEKIEAANRGKATASVIGIKSMGTRFNALMTIQIPLEQPKIKPILYNYNNYYNDYSSSNNYNYCKIIQSFFSFYCFPCGRRIKYEKYGCEEYGCVDLEEFDFENNQDQGHSNAARVSRATKFGVWDGLKVKEPKRDISQSITITIIFYYTVLGGVPSEADVKLAIEDMEELYSSCGWSGNLIDEKANFMKSEFNYPGIVQQANIFPS